MTPTTIKIEKITTAQMREILAEGGVKPRRCFNTSKGVSVFVNREDIALAKAIFLINSVQRFDGYNRPRAAFEINGGEFTCLVKVS